MLVGTYWIQGNLCVIEGEAISLVENVKEITDSQNIMPFLAVLNFGRLSLIR
jgi:hypothetical protein